MEIGQLVENLGSADTDRMKLHAWLSVQKQPGRLFGLHTSTKELAVTSFLPTNLSTSLQVKV